MVDVVGLGTPVMDLVVNVPRVPRGNSAVRANEVFHQGGGNCATALVASARLGVKAGILAKVGGDSTGDFVIKDFQFNGVDTSRILRDLPDTSSTYSIAVSEVDMGTRFFIIRRSTVSPLQPDEVDYDYIAGAKVLHLDSGSPASVVAAKFAREKGITVTIDAGAYTEDRVAIIPYIDIYIASEMFYNGMFKGKEDDLEGNCRKLHEMGPSVVWVTRGPLGCCGLVDGKFYNVPTFDEVKVIDTTGAGDVFHGAYIAAMLEGLSHPECARYACAVSSIKCMFVGGRTGIPNRETLRRFLEDGTVLTEEFEKRLDYYRQSFLAR
jgi:sugar/nucleoside kinase (ribokinase family)